MWRGEVFAISDCLVSIYIAWILVYDLFDILNSLLHWDAVLVAISIYKVGLYITCDEFHNRRLIML